MEFTLIFPTLLRYIVLVGLYFVAFRQFNHVSLQFLLTMVFFILNFFLFIFVMRDIFATPELMKNIYGVSDSEYQNPFVKYFVAIIGLTMILFICSLSIILAVFDYGKKKTNDFTSYTLTPSNKGLMQTFETSYQTYMIYFAILVYFIIFVHTTGKLRTIMLNIGCLLLSGILLSSSIYCCVIAVKFLDNKKYKRQLYQ
jgi:hypothetical protein